MIPATTLFRSPANPNMLGDVDQASTISQPALDTLSRRVSAATILSALFLLALWFVLCRHLSSEWSVNEQYNYGWFVPFFAAYLFWLRWETRPGVRGQRSEVRSQRWIAIGIAILALLTLLPVRLFEIGNPDWRPLGWVHAGAVATLTLLLIWAVGGMPWVRHFIFPIAFFFVAIPWISIIEDPIVETLMNGVAAIAAETVNLLGIPAQLQGNLIRVGDELVGVNEACSGVRSLQTSIMIGLLFGELKKLSVARRFALVGAAVAVALIANLARAFFLVWIAATQHAQAVSSWHDIAGYSIVAVVFITTVGLAIKLERRKAKVENIREEGPARSNELGVQPRPFLLSTFYFLLCLLWLFAIELAVEVWYRAHERDMVPRVGWTVQWPESTRGFREIKIDEEIKGALRFDDGREATWMLAPDLTPLESTGATTPATALRCFVFLFRWQPGTSTILRARAHRPDICLPSSGWKQTADYGVRDFPVADNLALPFRHFSFVRTVPGRPDIFAHAFFCIHEDRVRADVNGPTRLDPNSRRPTTWSFPDRARVVREGLRNPGQQVMEAVLIGNKEMPGAETEKNFEKLLAALVVVESRK